MKSQKWKEYSQISIENRTSPSTELQLRKGIQDKASEIAHMNAHTLMIGRVKIEINMCIVITFFLIVVMAYGGIPHNFI